MKKLLILLWMLLMALFGCDAQPAATQPKRPHRFMGLPPPPDCSHTKTDSAWYDCMGVGFKEGEPQ